MHSQSLAGFTPLLAISKPKANRLTLVANPSAGKEPDARKVLLVDDNVDLLNMAAHLFQQLGFETLTATSGGEAVELLRCIPDIDVLFSDVVMPGMSGIELGYEARKLVPGVRVILVSGYANAAAKAGHGRLEDFEFLLKPYRLVDVFKLLR